MGSGNKSLFIRFKLTKMVSSYADIINNLDAYATSLLFLLTVVFVAQLRIHLKRSKSPARETENAEKDGENIIIPDTKPPGFARLQTVYLIVFLLCNAADWLQGPYVYALYKEYGFTSTEIGLLFVVGFGVSGIFGTFVGVFTDRWGRRFMCMVYCVIYGIGCITKHFANFSILMFGRFLCGIATSILFSGFDAWIVHELQSREYDKNLINETFQKATFWNGFVAIFSGIIASVAASKYGKVAPFDTAAVCLIIALVSILVLWSENYGYRINSQDNAASPAIESNPSLLQLVKDAIVLCFSEKDILYCGIIQSCFESAMFIFVFSWTPALPPKVNHGIIFACFMSAVMVGSLIDSFVTQASDIKVLNISFMLGTVTFLPCVIFENEYARFTSFILFEMIVGLYFPKFYTLRSEVVPGDKRATILNLYRLPLNIIVVAICSLSGLLSVETVFLIVCTLLAAAFFATEGLIRHRKKQHIDGKAETSELAHLEA